MKQYPDSKSKGNRGEAIFESIVFPYATPHKVDGSNDIGVDFLCEWKNGQNPTGVMFAVQVKYYPQHKVTFISKDHKLNLLDQYSISPTISIDQQTQEYWRLLGMPCYLFVVIPAGNCADMFYKRYTPILTGNKTQQSKMPFYKANNGLSFLAFANESSGIGGFSRDLYIDQMRANYSKGQIAYMNPRRLGLKQFPDQDKDVFFNDIFQEYKINFEETFEQLRSALGNNDDQAIPSQAPPESE